MLFGFKCLFPLIATQLLPLLSGKESKAVPENCRVCMYLRAVFQCSRVVFKLRIREHERVNERGYLPFK